MSVLDRAVECEVGLTGNGWEEDGQYGQKDIRATHGSRVEDVLYRL